MGQSDCSPESEAESNCSAILELLILGGVTAVKNLKKHQVLGGEDGVCVQSLH